MNKMVAYGLRIVTKGMSFLRISFDFVVRLMSLMDLYSLLITLEDKTTIHKKKWGQA